MPRTTKIEKNCEECKEIFETLNTKSRFCCKKCAASFNGRGRVQTESTKKKISEKIKKFRKENPISKEEKNKHSITVGNSTKGKYNKNPQSIMELSKRTISKILKRLGLCCSQCKWNETVCDIHHINGRKIKNADSHKNLTYVCPNCHRKCHVGLIKKEQLINLEDYIGDKWKQFYYG